MNNIKMIYDQLSFGLQFDGLEMVLFFYIKTSS